MAEVLPPELPVKPPEPVAEVKPPAPPAPPPMPRAAGKPALPSRPGAAVPSSFPRPVVHARPSAPVARPVPSVSSSALSRLGSRPPVSSGPKPPAAPVSPPAPAAASAPTPAASAPTPAAGVPASASALAPAEARSRPKATLDIPADAEFNGELLRRVRESRGLTLQTLAERTRISAKHMDNIEADRYEALPATVYLRGMLMSVARELGLDPAPGVPGLPGPGGLGRQEAALTVRHLPDARAVSEVDTP